MSETIIRVENLGKKYVIPHAGAKRSNTFRDALMNGVRSLGQRLRHPWQGNGHDTSEEFWALKDVNFEVKRGDVVGIIGRNGAGKSTLLKILSRITEPTTGRVTIDGRVASLLEVGTGFHGELSGRENIYLNGAILGMGRAEIGRKFDEIVAFAEVEKFIDTPVKHYSSGMYMRLAFAVAAHLEPEILIVDEVLAVGDVAFQKKCLGRMGEVAREGRTVLFVSHNIAALGCICQRGILIANGKKEADGPLESVIRRYLTASTNREGERVFHLHPSKAFQFARARLLTPQGIASAIFEASESITVEVQYLARTLIRNGLLGARVSTVEGIPVFSTWQSDTLEVGECCDITPGVFLACFTLPGGLLVPGPYLLTLGTVDGDLTVLDLHEDVISFDIHPTAGRRLRRATQGTGVLNLHLPWEIRPNSNSLATPSRGEDTVEIGNG
jgi:lipopolysaccharide transport system ATP-binding protein